MPKPLNFTVNLDQIRKHLLQIAKPRDLFENPVTLRTVQSYLKEEFQSYGYKVIKHTFTFQGQSFDNLIAVSPTLFDSTPSTPCFLIGAHFDSVCGTSGADDNASGVAGMLETARILAQTKAKEHTVFVAFNAEEYGMVGSRFFIEELKKQTLPFPKKLTGMVSLEMIGFASDQKGSQKIPFFLKPFYPDVGNFIALVGNHPSKRLLSKAKEAFSHCLIPSSSTPLPLQVETLSLPMNGRLLPEVRLSDHSPFWDAGFQALLITDTSFFRNPHYHLPSDTLKTLDIPFMAGVIQGTVKLAESMASKESH